MSNIQNDSVISNSISYYWKLGVATDAIRCARRRRYASTRKARLRCVGLRTYVILMF
jgi:hypothetical protein